MIVLGIDPGTATTGYGLVREDGDGSLHLVAYGAITTPSDRSPTSRLHQLHLELGNLIQLHRPDTSAVEKLFFQRNVRTALAVGQARGVILLTLSQAGLEVVEYSPADVKLAVAGYGSAEKLQVQQMTRLLLDLPDIPRPDDAADALAIAICHLYSSHYQERIQQ